MDPLDADLEGDDLAVDADLDQELNVTPSWGLLDDPELLRETTQADDSRRLDSPLVATLFALIDDTSSRVIHHPIRPRVKATPAGLLRGELDVVKIEVPGVLAAGLLINRLVVRAERVRITPGIPPRLKAGPVGIRAYVSQRNVDRWVKTSRLPIRLQLTADGVVLTTGLRGVRMGQVQADLEVKGPFLRLVPKRATIVGVPAPLARFFRGYLPLPPLPRGARLTGIQHSDGELAVTFTIDDVDEALTPDIARRVRQLSRLPLPGLRR